MNSKISVVIPVYNAWNSLKKCIESLLKQSYPFVEIILIENNSTDGSEILCRRYETDYKNIVYAKCKVRGAAAARNLGIEVSSGDYIMFVDADDYVDPNYCKNMLQAVDKQNADLCISGIRRIRPNGIVLETCVGINFFCSSILEFQDEFLELYKHRLFNSPVNKIYKKSFIKIMFDNDFQIGEDLLFNLEYIKQERIKICGIEDVLYNYVQFPELSKDKLSYYSKNRLKTNILLYNKLKEMGRCADYDEEYFYEIKKLYLNNVWFCYREYISLGESYSANKVFIKEMVNNPIIQELASVNFENPIKQFFVLLIRKKSYKILSFVLSILGMCKKARKKCYQLIVRN